MRTIVRSRASSWSRNRVTSSGGAGQVAAPRHVLILSPAGRAELLRQLRTPDELFITDENRWFTLLAFLRHLDDPAAQGAVLRRRLEMIREAECHVLALDEIIHRA